MTEITLTKFMEYYFTEKISFLDIITLLEEDHISLENGIVSKEDLRKIISLKNLSDLDMREFQDRPEQKKQRHKTLAELESLIEDTRKELYSLEKNGEASNKIIELNEKIEEVYENMLVYAKAHVYLEQAKAHSEKLRGLLKNAQVKDNERIANNLLRLAQFYQKSNNFKESLPLLKDAKYKYQAELLKLRLSEARERSEYAARIGVINYMLFCAERRVNPERSDLQLLRDAKNMLEIYVAEDRNSPYYKHIKKIDKELEKWEN